jgi:RNA methyltransferase, TrmH family
VLEGFHPVKHALRFGAHLEELVTRDAAALERLAERLAPDIAGDLRSAREVDGELFDRLAPLPPNTGVMALADRPRPDPAAVLASPRRAPIVLLEDPRDLGNIGACVRVAAAADAAAMLTSGEHDPWYADAVRGGAGLHFALPVGSIEALPASDRPLLAIDPEGEELSPERLPPRAVLAFGTERHGLTGGLLERADARIAIPMRPGVSSLNLATSVAVTLFTWRLAN